MNPNQAKLVLRAMVALAFIAAGIAHFLRTEFFVSIVPPYLPHPQGLVEFTGVCEILGGVGLMLPGVRRLSGICLILLLVAVLPANIYMLTRSYHETAFSTPTALLTLRLPLQFIFMHVVNILSR